MSEQPEANKPEEKNSSLKNKFPKKPNLPKNPFNFYWIYGIIAVALIAIQLMNFGSPLKEVKTSDFFENMLQLADKFKWRKIYCWEPELQQFLSKYEFPFYQTDKDF